LKSRNWSRFVPEIDFITALGKLLRDGYLRDEFAANPSEVSFKLGVGERERSALIQLVPEDLEFQAAVLLRKRLKILENHIPRTLGNLGKNAWQEFHQFARNRCQTSGQSSSAEACDFLLHLKNCDCQLICKREFNRLEFQSSKRQLRFAWIKQNNFKGAFQILVKYAANRWGEILVGF
jgi:hypothetical protein